MQLSQYQHQSTPVSSTGNVCTALRYRNIDPLGRRHEYTGCFTHEVSATDTWCMLVGSCLQCRGASAIWFVNHWWHLTSSTLISGHVARLDHGVPLQHMMLCVWWWIPTKAERPTEEDRRVALATSATRFRRMPTLCCYLRCGDLKSPGITERRKPRNGHSDYATMMMVSCVKNVKNGG